MVSIRYIQVLKDMYEGGTTIAHTVGGDARDFPILVGLYQENIPWCMMFTDDIVLINETRGVNRKLEFWRSTLELKGFKSKSQ